MVEKNENFTLRPPDGPWGDVLYSPPADELTFVGEPLKSHTMSVFDVASGKYVELDFKTGRVESNIPEDEQIHILVDAMKEVARQYGLAPHPERASGDTVLGWHLTCQRRR